MEPMSKDLAGVQREIEGILNVLSKRDLKPDERIASVLLAYYIHGEQQAGRAGPDGSVLIPDNLANEFGLPKSALWRTIAMLADSEVVTLSQR
jgi:hypothetical protein